MMDDDARSLLRAIYSTEIDLLPDLQTKTLTLEPLLEHLGDLDLRGIHWVIVGGESGPRHRPIDLAWVRAIRDQCEDAGVAFFLKQWGGRTSTAGGCLLDGQEWKQYPPLALRWTAAHLTGVDDIKLRLRRLQRPPFDILPERIILTPMAEPRPRRLTKDQALRLVHQWVADSGNIEFTNPHCVERMNQRNISDRQVLDCHRKGVMTEGPYIDQKSGEWRVNITRCPSGEELTCGVVLLWEEKRLRLITVLPHKGRKAP